VVKWVLSQDGSGYRLALAPIESLNQSFGLAPGDSVEFVEQGTLGRGARHGGRVTATVTSCSGVRAAVFGTWASAVFRRGLQGAGAVVNPALYGRIAST